MWACRGKAGAGSRRGPATPPAPSSSCDCLRCTFPARRFRVPSLQEQSPLHISICGSQVLVGIPELRLDKFTIWYGQRHGQAQGKPNVCSFLNITKIKARLGGLKAGCRDDWKDSDAAAFHPLTDGADGPCSSTRSWKLPTERGWRTSLQPCAQRSAMGLSVHPHGLCWLPELGLSLTVEKSSN